MLKGVTKNYEATFSEGLNVIWGDMDTGKSSILNLIDYCFGGSNETLRYAEISANARVVYLQVDLNGTRVTIERDLVESSGAVRVFSGSVAEIGETFPRLMSASPSVEMPDGWLSDFVLECLNIPRVKIKQSSRDDVAADRLSIRDLFKLIYLKQTRVGSDNLLDFANPPLFLKNVEIQKFVYNIHNEALATLKGECSDVMNERRLLNAERDAVLKFLKSVNISATENTDSIEGQLTLKDEELSFLVDTIQSLKNDFKLSSSIAIELKARLAELRFNYDRVLSEIQQIDAKQANYAQLRSTYKLDLDNLTVAQRGKSIFSDRLGKMPLIGCPTCATPLAIAPEEVSAEELAAATRSFKNRLAGVGEAIEQLFERRLQLQEKADAIGTALKLKTAAYDEENFADVSGLITSIETLEAARSELQTEVATLHNSISIRRRFNDLENSLENKGALVEKIKRAIKEIEDGATNLDAVLGGLNSYLSTHISQSGLRNVHGVYFNEKFIPHFRNLSYYRSTSGGVRTVLSILSFLSRMQYLINNGGNLPPFLMIDTPGQNIGRNSRPDEESLDEEVSDPFIYDKVYNAIIRTLKNGKEKDKRCQIIVVDNDLPTMLRGDEPFNLVKRFSKGSKNFERGLIDDAKE